MSKQNIFCFTLNKENDTSFMHILIYKIVKIHSIDYVLESY